MNKAAIKNFAIWARNKLIAEITYKAGLLGITEKGIKTPQPQSTKDVQFFDIGTKEPYSITGVEIEQRRNLVEILQRKEKQSDYKTAYKSVIEEVAYTWFNRLIAVRFMEVNDYLPSRIRVLSSESSSKIEPDLVTSPFEADLEFAPNENERIIQLKNDNKLDELFRMLFIKLCNALNATLPELFEKTNHYTELLMNVSFTDKDGVVYRLVHDIPEDDFNVDKEGQVEIIGWLYQYYNTEPKDETFDLLKKNVKITKERIPAATQLFTPDWIVRYMVENSLGRLWIDGHPNNELKAGWKYYLDEAEQESAVRAELDVIRDEYKSIKPEDIKIIDPCMGSGHILVYAFDILMQIYESYGYSQRDAAKSILVNNLYGLDIDNRAYQLAYFALMMKARQYNRRILNGEIGCNVYAIQESNGINHTHLEYLGYGMSDTERNIALNQLQYLIDTFTDAKEYGSILTVKNCDWHLLYSFICNVELSGQITLDQIGIEDTRKQLRRLVEIGSVMERQYDVVVTNPPYMRNRGMNEKLLRYVKKHFDQYRSDLYSIFVYRNLEFMKKHGYQAMITQHSFLFLSSFEQLRHDIFQRQIINMAHLGTKAFEEIGGEVVQTVAFVIRNDHFNKYLARYKRLVDIENAERKEVEFFADENNYYAMQEDFTVIPGSPIAYWISDKLREAFNYGVVLSDVSAPRKGNSTSNNDKFLRYWYEVQLSTINIGAKNIVREETLIKRWFPYNKGGSYRKWYGNNEYVVDWKNDAEEMRNIPTAVIANYQFFMQPGITWSTISGGKIGVRRFGNGFIFDNKGECLFANNQEELDYFAGFMNSNVAMEFLKFLSPTLDFNCGNIARLPIISTTDDIKTIVIQIVQSNHKLMERDWDSFESSWDFTKHPFLVFRSEEDLKKQRSYYPEYNGYLSYTWTYMDKGSLQNAFMNWGAFNEIQFNQLKANEIELNRIFIEIYSLQDDLTPEIEDKDITIRKADLGRDVRSFLSYAVGCMFGRYSLDVDELTYAGGEWNDSRYSTFIPDKDNIIPITDEQYFEDDIVGLFCAFLKKTFGADTLEENLDFIAKALGNKGNTSREVIRNYFLKDFFKDHCKVYQKRPIYWLFDSGREDGFKALIYLHRYNEDTIGNLRVDYLHRMQRVYDSEIARMQETIDNSNNAREVAAATKRKEKLTKQLKETKEYDEKIAHLALARVSINLDDGVKVNYDKVQTGTDGKKLDVLTKI